MALGLGPSSTGSCGMNGPASDCIQTLGPGGEPVTDSFYFVRQPLDGNGSITVAGDRADRPDPRFFRRRRDIRRDADAQRAGALGQGRHHHQGEHPAGSAYAAMMITGGHGVRMQYDYTGDVAGIRPGDAGSFPRRRRAGCGSPGPATR